MSTATTAAWTCWRDPRHTETEPTIGGWPRCTACGATPDHPGRWPYALAAHPRLLLVVPTPGSGLAHTVAPGSALVTRLAADGPAEVCYEGFTHGQHAELDAAQRWQLGVQQAAGRLLTAYPSTARAFAPTADYTPVGEYDPAANAVTITDQAALDAWLADQPGRA